MFTGAGGANATFGPGDPNETTLGAGGVFVGRYAREGTLDWVTEANGVGSSGALSIDTFAGGSCVIAGIFGDSLVLGAGEPNETTLTGHAGSFDAFVARYDADGTLVWGRTIGDAAGDDRGADIAALADGSCVYGGDYRGTVTFGSGEATETISSSAGDRDAFLARHAADGLLLWARAWGGSGDDSVQGIDEMPDGSLVVSGWFSDTAVFGAGARRTRRTYLLRAPAARRSSSASMWTASTRPDAHGLALAWRGLMEGESRTVRLLRRLHAGDAAASEELMPLVYGELHRIAERLMADERGDHTLQPTALIHDAWIRLVGNAPPEFEDRCHFLRVAARAMRRVLVDHARAKRADKRGGGKRPASLDDVLEAVAPDRTLDLLALDEALEALGGNDPELLRVVELRYFAGLTLEETGAVLGMTVQQTHRAWTFAKGWLRRELGGAA